MTDIKVFLRLPFKDYIYIVDCLELAATTIEQKSEVGKVPLNSKDEYYLNWTRRVIKDIQNQGEKSTYDEDTASIEKALAEATEYIEEFLTVMRMAKFAVWKHFVDEAKKGK
jgi:acyl-CoA synthetase (NDP forming)